MLSVWKAGYWVPFSSSRVNTVPHEIVGYLWGWSSWVKAESGVDSPIAELYLNVYLWGT